TPRQSVTTWVYTTGPSEPCTVTRDPSAHCSTVVSCAAARAEQVTGPDGTRCHGPSLYRGCSGYSSYTRSSLPTSPGCSSSLPVPKSTMLLRPPPCAGSTVTWNRSLPTVTAVTGRQESAITGSASVST